MYRTCPASPLRCTIIKEHAELTLVRYLEPKVFNYFLFVHNRARSFINDVTHG